MVDPEHPGPYFVGLIQPLGAIMPLAEAQAEWLITGEGALPSYDAMRVQIREYDERVRRRFASGRDTIQVDFDQYPGGEKHQPSRRSRRSGDFRNGASPAADDDNQSTEVHRSPRTHRLSRGCGGQGASRASPVSRHPRWA